MNLVPIAFAGDVREEVFFLWRGARVDEVHGGFGIFQYHGASVGGYLSQKKDHVLSVKTHRVLGADPLSSILRNLSNIAKIGEIKLQLPRNKRSESTRNFTTRLTFMLMLILICIRFLSKFSSHQTKEI